ncbi:unnamed protein product [Miscanthus lutarioriparius]|uniref:Uncharacterized protein n=1 Tax=Miscanthus lutarioriparius TaxID=422564 RepID=A0A811SFM3_9POAL|nr:unnamed protein product [Miscanthus lutarioriparius]
MDVMAVTGAGEEVRGSPLSDVVDRRLHRQALRTAWLGTLSPEARQPASRQGTAATTPALRPPYRDGRPELVNITAAAGISQSTQMATAGPQGEARGRQRRDGWVRMAECEMRMGSCGRGRRR